MCSLLPQLQYRHLEPPRSSWFATLATRPSSLAPAVIHSHIASRGICISKIPFLCLSLQMAPIPLRIKSKLLCHLAHSLSSPTLSHPSHHPLHSGGTGLLKCAKYVPILGPLCQLFPFPGMLFPLTFAWMDAFCHSVLSLAITSSRKQRKHLLIRVAPSLSHHSILLLCRALITT